MGNGREHGGHVLASSFLCKGRSDHCLISTSICLHFFVVSLRNSDSYGEAALVSYAK